MTLASVQYVNLLKQATGIVVRPPKTEPSCCPSNRSGRIPSSAGDNDNSGHPQALVFFSDAVHELLNGPSDKPELGFKLSEQRLPVAGALRCAAHAIYEPTTNAIYYVEGASAVMRLDAYNSINLVAGHLTDCAFGDGRGASARFVSIHSLAADGKGHIFVADGNGPSRIRVLRASTSEVFTVRGSSPGSYFWGSLSYDAVSDVLVAATFYAVCHLPMYGGSTAGGWATSPRLVAGSWTQTGNALGPGASARFSAVTAVVAAAGGCLYIQDRGSLRLMDCTETVSSVLSVNTVSYSEPRHAAILPGGELAASGYNVGSDCNAITIASTRGVDGGFSPSSAVLAGWCPAAPAAPAAVRNLPDLLLLADDGDDACHGGGGGGGGVAAAVVRIRAADGQSFVAHRSVLVTRSEYLRQLLAPGGGFADSGTAEINLEDADPRAVALLLSYMYTGNLSVPEGLLRPVVELAGRLLMPEACTRPLQQALLAEVTPGSVVSELVWAERHALVQLVPQLKAYLLRNRREVVAAEAAEAREGSTGGMYELATECPAIAADLLLKSLSV
jgi:hypothetical protein